MISLMVETNKIILLLVIFSVNFLGVIFFSKILFTILYGIPEEISDDNFVEVQKHEYIMLNFLILIISSLILLIYFF